VRRCGPDVDPNASERDVLQAFDVDPFAGSVVIVIVVVVGVLAPGPIGE